MTALPAAARSRSADPFFDEDEYFSRQRSTTRELPDPEPLLANLTRCVLETMAGARELDQIARWVTDDVYRSLQKRVVLAARSRRARGTSPQRPVFTIGRIRTFEPTDGVLEAVVLVHQRQRSRAVAIRLEGLDSRWRASVITVL